MIELGKMHGKASKKTTDIEREIVRDKVFEKFLK